MIHEIFEYCITYIRYAETDSDVIFETAKNQPKTLPPKLLFHLAKFKTTVFKIRTLLCLTYL